MWRIPPAWTDEAAARARWSAARPFPHLVVDDFVGPADLDDLLAILEEEPVERYEGDLFVFDATAPEPRTAELRALRDAFAATLSAPLTRITGKAVSRVDMRAYAYRPGHYLLPHSDHQADLQRRLAFAFYLPSPEPPRGGELELYDCDVAEAGELTRIESALLIEPRPNRIAIFDVGDVSLHQVREVLAGLRLSLAGWFYP